jgi:hypothetical protein
MSLWTPDGEHRVPRPDAEPADQDHDHGHDHEHDHAADDGGDPLAGLSPEERAQVQQMAAEMDEVRRQLASVPASVVVTNHAMGLYELAAIHLSSSPPQFHEAQLAIDGMGALVEGLEGRLGENEGTLRDALGQLRLAYVQLKNQAGASSPD